MDKNDDFFIGYVDHVSGKTRSTLRTFIWTSVILIVLSAIIFAFTQNRFKNSSFELTNSTSITGIYSESPYPMLKVQTSEKSFKNIVLLGFGKSGAHPFLASIKNETTQLLGAQLQIEGNLIYFNGKTLLQITDDQKISLVKKANPALLSKGKIIAKSKAFTGEIIDPKCYFGVMKPGHGKIHRSCAVRCISGGIPPVLATTDHNEISEYFLLTDVSGNPIHEAILPFVGKPSIVTGTVVELEDWYQLRIDISAIENLNKPSVIY